MHLPQVLEALRSKQVLEPQTVRELEDCLKDRDIGLDVETTNGGTSKQMKNGAVRLDKRQIEQRIEEDRERHKRQRESIWAVGGGGVDDEFEKMWGEASEVEEDDYLAGEEDEEERKQAIEFG